MQALTTIDYADEYCKTKLDGENWNKLTEPDKQKLLYEATRHIYAIQGFKYTPEVLEVLTAIPDDLQQACCEVCLKLTTISTDDVHIINQNLGIKSISFGKDSVSYDNSIKTSSLGFNNALFSDYAQSLLNKYILKGVPYV